jgi:hypothetical protein
MATKKKIARKKTARKKPARTYVKNRQTKGQGNNSVKKDKQRKALPPGKRRSASGKTYYEYRKDHTDIPGKLTGYHTDQKSHNVKIKIGRIGKINDNKQISVIAKESKLSGAVIRILKRKVKDYNGNYESLLKDILHDGLQSGIIGELIYYTDTLAWYKKYQKDIMALLNESMWSYGTRNPADLFGKKWDADDPFANDTQNQNLLAWYSFEETCMNILNRLGYEY